MTVERREIIYYFVVPSLPISQNARERNLTKKNLTFWYKSNPERIERVRRNLNFAFFFESERVQRADDAFVNFELTYFPARERDNFTPRIIVKF